MGYYARCSDSRVGVHDEPAALAALKRANERQPLARGTHFQTGETLASMLARATSLDEALGWMFWEVRRGPDGSLRGLALDNVFDPFEFEAALKAIAPFVTSGSHLVIEGEDGTLWRASFRSRRVKLVVTEIYCGFEVTESRARIDDESAALAALRAEHARVALLDEGEGDVLRSATTLEEALACFDWGVIRDGEGRVVALTGDWAPRVDEVAFADRILRRFAPARVLRLLGSDRLLAALAPFVASGSYVLIEDEAERRWRVTFDAGRVRTKAL